MRFLINIGLFFVCLAGNVAHAESKDVFTLPYVGLEITKQSDWHYINVALAAESAKSVQFQDEEFAELAAKSEAVPLAVITQYPESYEDVNPSLKIDVQPLTNLNGKTAIEFSNFVLGMFSTAVKDFEILQKTVEVDVGAFKATYFRMRYTTEFSDKTSYRAVSELWIITRDKYYLLLGAATLDDDKTNSREEIAGMLKSLKLVEQKKTE